MQKQRSEEENRARPDDRTRTEGRRTSCGTRWFTRRGNRYRPRKRSGGKICATRNPRLPRLRKTAAAGIVSIIRRALMDLACGDIERMRDKSLPREVGSGGCRGPEKTLLGGRTHRRESKRARAGVRTANRTGDRESHGNPGALAIRTSLEMSWGIELRGSGQRIGWKPETYLDSLEVKLRAVVEEHAEAEHPLAVG